MNFKKPKRQVIDDAHAAAYSIVVSNLNQLHSSPMNSLHNTLERTIANAIEAAIASLVHDIYTDEEFEQDLNLRT